MVLAIWIGATVEHVQFNHWILIGLFVVTVLCMLLRLVRGASLTVLEGTAIAAIWVATRFIVAPAFILVAAAWFVCWALGLGAAPALLKALVLLSIYGGGAILATSALADLAAAIRGPRRGSPSDS